MGFILEVDVDEFLELMECETEARLRVAEIMARRRRANAGEIRRRRWRRDREDPVRLKVGMREEDSFMMYYALVFLVVALIAGVLGFSGIAGISANIAWILFVIGLVLALVFFIRGRGTSI